MVFYCGTIYFWPQGKIDGHTLIEALTYFCVVIDRLKFWTPNFTAERFTRYFRRSSWSCVYVYSSCCWLHRSFQQGAQSNIDATLPLELRTGEKQNKWGTIKQQTQEINCQGSDILKLLISKNILAEWPQTPLFTLVYPLEQQTLSFWLRSITNMSFIALDSNSWQVGVVFFVICNSHQYRCCSVFI